MELIRDLAAFCTRHLWEEKLLVTPSRSAGLQLRERIARGGGGWLNLHVASVEDVARRILGHAHPACARVLTETQALCLLEELAASEGSAAEWFAELAHSPGFHRALLRSINDCLLADLDPALLPTESFAAEKKAAAFRLLAGRFTETCREQDAYTGAMLLRLAANGEPAPGAAQADFVLVEESVAEALTPVEQRVLEAAGQVRVFRWENGNPTTTPRFLRADNEECELRGILRDVIRSGARWDEVELVLARVDLLPLAFELTRLYNIPATFDPGVPLHYSKAARTVVAWLRWLSGGYDAAHLIRMMYDGVPAPYESVVEGVKGGRLQMAHLLREAAAGWGRDHLLPRIERAIERLAARSDDESSRAVLQARANAAWLRQLLAVTPEEHAGRLSLRETAAGARRLINEMCRDKYPGEKDAMLRLADLLAEYDAAPDLHLPPAQIAKRLIEDIRAAVFPMVLQEPGTAPVPTTRPLPGHLHVSILERGGWCGRVSTFAVGMDAQSIPPAPRQNPVLLDAERRRISERTGMPLPLAADAAERGVRSYDSFLRRCAGALTLSWPSRGLLDGGDRFPSRLLLETLRRSRGDEHCGYEALYAEAGIPAGIVPDSQPLSLAEWHLTLHDVFAPDALAARLHEISPLLREGARAEAARRSPAFTAWDGFVGDAVAPAEAVYSASSLQLMASCPYTWFLERRLGLREPEPWLRDDRNWLDAREHGALLHHVLYRFMSTLVERDERPEAARHQPLIEEIAREAMSQWEHAVPLPSRAAYLAEERRLIAECGIFLREEERAGGAPVMLENPFGLDESEAAVPLRTDRGTVLLRGRIDRADADSRGDVIVWDYKTGSVHAQPTRPLDRGRDLQHAVYAHAARILLERRGTVPRSVTAGYYAISERTQGQRLIMPDCSAQLPHVIALLDTLRETQVFPHSRDARDCDFCRFQPVCGAAPGIVAQTREKIDDDDNAMLEPYRRLHDVR